jgi:hypothetical protein
MIIMDSVKIKGDISTGQNLQYNDIHSEYRLERYNTGPTGADRPSRLTSAEYMNGTFNT